MHETLVLMYHEVNEKSEWLAPVRYMEPEYNLSPDQFREQIAYLSGRTDFRVLGTAELVSGNRHDTPTVAITFDDGLAGNRRFAADILLHHKVPATFFITAGKINSTRYMTWPEIKEMDHLGFSIQSHTLTHPMLAYCNKGQLESELGDSKKMIEDRIGRSVSMLSLPFGNMNKTVLERALFHGYTSVFTSELYYHKLEGGVNCYGRIAVHDTYALPTFIDLVNPGSRLLRRLVRNRQIKNGIRNVIGLPLYRRLFRLRHGITLEP